MIPDPRRKATASAAAVNAPDAAADLRRIEKTELVPLLVVKRDNRREPFDAAKIKSGVIHACEKLPVSMQQIDGIVSRIEQTVYNTMEGEISSQRIGDMVMAELKQAQRCGLRSLCRRVPQIYRSGQLHGGAHPSDQREQNKVR